MALKKITKITNKQIAEKGVQALADRPNLTAQYGASGLSAAQLKLWFDKLATFLAERINEISDAISSDEATNYIRVCLDEYGVDNLGALITAFTDGDFAAKILQLFPSAGSAQKQALQAIINNVAKQLADLEEKKLATATFNQGVKTLNARIDDTHKEIQALADEVETKEIYAHYSLVAEQAETAKAYTKGGKIDKKFREIEEKFVDNVGGGDNSGGYAIYAEQAETARNYTKGGEIDRILKKFDERLKTLENNT